MANMFSGKSDKKIPSTLSECIASDPTVTNLHHWSERLESLGTILFLIIIIIGIIVTLSSTASMSEIDEDMVVGTFFTSALTWGLYAFIEYCAYHVLALLISALASITQNTIISANVALLNANTNDTDDCTNNIEQNDIQMIKPEEIVICKQCREKNKSQNTYCWSCNTKLK